MALVMVCGAERSVCCVLARWWWRRRVGVRAVVGFGVCGVGPSIAGGVWGAMSGIHCRRCGRCDVGPSIAGGDVGRVRGGEDRGDAGVRCAGGSGAVGAEWVPGRPRRGHLSGWTCPDANNPAAATDALRRASSWFSVGYDLPCGQRGQRSHTKIHTTALSGRTGFRSVRVISTKTPLGSLTPTARLRPPGTTVRSRRTKSVTLRSWPDGSRRTHQWTAPS
jgi:hypothetical protein